MQVKFIVKELRREFAELQTREPHGFVLAITCPTKDKLTLSLSECYQ